MFTLPINDSFNKFYDLFNNSKKEIIKVETLQDYSKEDNCPSLQAYFLGDIKKSLDLLNENDDDEWKNCCLSLYQRGINFSRYHITKHPFSPYLNWEIEFYKHINIPLWHEKVFLVNEDKLNGFHIPSGDFFIFDNEMAISNNYIDGLCVSQTFYEKNDDIFGLLKLAQAIKLNAIIL